MKNVISNFINRIVLYTQISRISYLLILSGITGILGGFGAIGVIYTIHFFQSLAVGTNEHLLVMLEELVWWKKLLIPIVGFTVVGYLVNRWAHEAKGHGVPEVMAAIALKQGRIRPIVVIIKAIASAITIATGGSVGREGPIVQIGSGIGSTIGQMLRLSPERLKILVGCGAAAGIAATFNAPIAGAFFALEVIIGNFALHSFSPIIISSVLATVISRSFLGDFPSFLLREIYILKSAWEIPLYIVFGIVCGFVALMFIQSLHWTEEWFDNLKISPYLKATIGGFFVGIILLFVPNTFGTGHDTIESILNFSIFSKNIPGAIQHGFLAYFYVENHLIFLWFGFVILLFIKLIATNITLSSGGSGGIFAPSLFLGAISGAIYGMLVNYLFPEMTAPIGAYAIVGMGAVVAGATHAPITATLIIFELTNDYKIILPMLITCTLSTLMCRRMNKDSIYTLKLSLQGINLNQSPEAILMKSYKVKDVMRKKAPMIQENESFNGLVKIFLENQNTEYFVVDQSKHFQGTISLHHLKSVMNDKGLRNLIVAQDIMEHCTQVVQPETELSECMNKFAVSDQEFLPVVDQTNSRTLLGYVSHNDLINLYDREILRKDFAEVKFVRESNQVHKKESICLPADYDVEYIKINKKLHGKTICELDLRKQFSVSIIAIYRSGIFNSESQELPTAESVLYENDLIMVIGKIKDIQKAF